MLNLPLDIDAIVRQVLADLGAKGAPTSNVSSNVPSNARGDVLPQKGGHGGSEKTTLRLLDSLVTLAALEGQLDGVREIVISPKAVVTPAVRDLLDKKTIRLAIGETMGLSENTVAVATLRQTLKPTIQPIATVDQEKPGVWLVLHGQKRKPEMLLHFLQQESTLAEDSFSCIVKATQAAADRLKQAEDTAARVIVVTNYSAAAMALANRHPAIRAIQVATPEQVIQDAAVIGANMLVLHADRLSAYRMKELAKAFVFQTTTQCPDVFMKALT
ncbi:MAG: hypothetical protein FWC50_14660 [Planctomycetaceae bacterium]|nr:hypothetical protein [Planctomycetaceae bacterium]